MSTEPLVTVLAQNTFCDKVFRTSIFEREGYRPQIKIEMFQLVTDSVEMKLRSTLALRPGVAREVGLAILRGVDMLAHAPAEAVS